MTLLDLKPKEPVRLYEQEFMILKHVIIDGKLHTVIVSSNGRKCCFESDTPITETEHGYELRIAPM